VVPLFRRSWASVSAAKHSWPSRPLFLARSIPAYFLTPSQTPIAIRMLASKYHRQSIFVARFIAHTLHLQFDRCRTAIREAALDGRLVCSPTRSSPVQRSSSPPFSQTIRLIADSGCNGCVCDTQNMFSEGQPQFRNGGRPFRSLCTRGAGTQFTDAVFKATSGHRVISIDK
jgi:hypothetical protein